LQEAKKESAKTNKGDMKNAKSEKNRVEKKKKGG